MNPQFEPPGKLSDDAAALLQAGRSGTSATPEQRARVRWGVQRRLVAGAGAMGVFGIAAWSSVAKAALVVTGVAVLGGVGYAVADAERDSTRTNEAPRHAPEAAHLETPRTQQASPPVDDAAPTKAAARPNEEPKSEAAKPVEPIEPIEPSVARRKASTASNPARPVQEDALPTAADLKAEVQALSAARRALRDGNPEDAARHLKTYDRNVSGGTLAEERAATEIFVLCSQGRTTLAQRRMLRFADKWPNSALRGRIAAACSEGRKPPSSSKSRADDGPQE